MNRIDKKFKDLKKTGKKAFIAFITAGFPSLPVTEKLIYALDKIGVDILELGVPFSDPMADGPVIQAASQEALRKNTHLVDILNLVKKARKKTEMPICLMTYYNPVFCFPDDKFILEAKKSGVDGVIIPDLPPEEGKGFIAAAKGRGLDTICFLSPTSSKKRIKLISRVAQGFIYYVSLTGVTGARSKLPEDIRKNVRLIKRYARKPVCVGFGVSTPSQAREIKKIADGVIIGSAIVKKIKENSGSPDLIKRVSNFVAKLNQ
ncbi:MAG: tryptophan synthase subunit alpha [Candidatus Omnitrophica bacterium]|nr:tryptophan synthase subunit alpha [Candidatus Omnitrophota bacterium]